MGMCDRFVIRAGNVISPGPWSRQFMASNLPNRIQIVMAAFLVL